MQQIHQILYICHFFLFIYKIICKGGIIDIVRISLYLFFTVADLYTLSVWRAVGSVASLSLFLYVVELGGSSRNFYGE